MYKQLDCRHREIQAKKKINKFLKISILKINYKKSLSMIIINCLEISLEGFKSSSNFQQ